MWPLHTRLGSLLLRFQQLSCTRENWTRTVALGLESGCPCVHLNATSVRYEIRSIYTKKQLRARQAEASLFLCMHVKLTMPNHTLLSFFVQSIEALTFHRRMRQSRHEVRNEDLYGFTTGNRCNFPLHASSIIQVPSAYVCRPLPKFGLPSRVHGNSTR